MRNHELDHLLGSLPREVASPELSERVLTEARTAGTTASPSSPRRIAVWVPALIALAALMALMALPPTVERWQESRQREEARRQVEHLEHLRQEYRALERELQELQRLALESQPVVRVGENDEFDFILDLRDLSAADQRLVTPALYRP